MRVTHRFAPAVVVDPVEALRREVYDRHALDACAQAVGVSHQTLSKQFNPEEEAQLSLRRAAAIERFLETDALAECFAARRGGIFVKMPPLPPGHESATLVDDFARVVAEFGDVSRQFAAMLADGRVTRAEVDRLQKEMRELFVAGERLARDAKALEQREVAPLRPVKGGAA